MSQSTVEIPSSNSSEPSAATIEAQKPATQGQPKTEAPSGAAFAALDRRTKAAIAAERQLEQKRQEIETKEKSLAELNGLDPVSFIETIAKQRGIPPEELFKEYVQRKTGQPTPDKVLAESKDPAVQALTARQEQLARENAELKAQREAEKQAVIEERNAEARRKAIADCQESAKAVFTDESDYPFFFNDAEQLGREVYVECSARINAYIESNLKAGYSREEAKPTLEEVNELVKNMPAELLKARLATKAGQKLISMKARAETPPAAVPGFRPRLSPRKVTDDDSAPKIRTSIDHNARLDAAIARLPKGMLLPGEKPTSE